MAGESVIMDFLRNQEEKQNQNGQQEKQIVYMDIEDLEASKENFYGLRDLEALKASISLHGLLQPILVIPAKIEGKYTVLGGGRRRQAIEELVDEGKEELRRVPCIISDGKIQGEDTEEEPDEVQELIGKLNIISANSFREKTDWEKMEETLQIGSIIKELKNLGKLKGNVREMQVELSGIKGTQIARYNAIMNHLSLELMQAFKNNDFGISVAYELSRLSDDYQQQAWEIFLENKILTLSDAEKLHNLQKEEEENLEAQMEIQEFLEQETSTDNRQDVPIVEELEEVPCFKKGGVPYGYTWHEAVKEYLKTAYTEDSAKIKSLGKEYLVLRRPERTFFCDAQGNTLFEVENARLESEYSWLQQKENIAPSQQSGKCIHSQQYVCTLTEEQKAVAGDGKNCNEKCCWNCINHGNCKYECNASANREEKTIVVEAAPNVEVELEESTEKQQSLVERGWMEQEPVAPSQQKIEDEVQQEQPSLPKMKNNDQRKEWLKDYRSWGIWYKDEHIGVTYYRYQFENGAVLIVEEYENENEYTGAYISSYFHLVGGPEPPRKNGIPKWNRNKKYNRYQNNETELIEFLKEIQKE